MQTWDNVVVLYQTTLPGEVTCFFKNIHVHTCKQTYKHTSIQSYMHTYTHTYTHRHAHTYLHTYTYIHIHTDKRTYVHTYIHKRILKKYYVEVASNDLI
jgi:hypothetical protein